ncbi:unnamed protein product [Candida verbasci]|uniref:Uncharacterized protein n=1 Tax=Candida verbasci TaxID=1227364 RepID=A0A9W4TT05_9ASCO|nr:unnamed protein product [Candida verbasci]
MSITYLNTTPKTPVYHKLPISISNTSKFLIFIPGNPGLVNFYLTYLDLLQLHYKDFEILCIGHAGFAPKLCYDTYDVKYQINHKVQILKNLIIEKNQVGITPEFFFLSHSVGSYVIQRTIKLLYEDSSINEKFKIIFSGFITPTIYDIKSSSSGIKLSKMMSYHIPIIYLALIFKFLVNLLLPDNLIRKILHYQLITTKSNLIADVEPGTNLGFENSVDGGYNLIKHSNIINQALTMAQEEMTVIDKKEEINDWYFQNTKFVKWCFFANEDHWVSESSRSHLYSKYKDGINVEFEICKNEAQPISHSFCVTQSKEFAEITIDRINKYTNID